MNDNDFKKLEDSINTINAKIDNILLEFKNKNTRFKFFKKKTLEELLSERGIVGKISKIDGITSSNNYEVDCEDAIYFLKFNEGLFRNRIEIIIKKNKK